MKPERTEMETSISFKLSEDMADLIRRDAAHLDVSVSQLVRAAYLNGRANVLTVRGASRIELEDIRDAVGSNQKFVKPE